MTRVGHRPHALTARRAPAARHTPAARRILSRLAGLLVLLFAAGCASTSAGKLPPLRFDGALPTFVQQPVGYSVEFRVNGEPRPDRNTRLAACWESMASESGTFAQLGERADAPEGGAHVALVLDDRRDGPLALISGFLCGITLTILPCYAVDSFVLTAELRRPGRQPVTLRYEEDVTTWIQLFLVFGMGGPTPADRIDATVDELLRHAARGVARVLGSP
jgi:hypothetical protein